MTTDSSVSVGARGERENFYLHALLGAVVTTVVSFIPFSPVLGGAVAGYLQNRGTDTGVRVGAISGLIASLPLAAVFFVLFSVMSLGSITSGEVVGPMFVVAIVGAILLFAGLYIVGLSAFGGYVGAAFADSRTEKRLAEELGPTDEAHLTAESTAPDETTVTREPGTTDETTTTDESVTSTGDADATDEGTATASGDDRTGE